MWSEKSFLPFSKRFLVAICRAQPRAGCKCIWKRLVWNPLQASTVEHSWIWLMIPIAAALVCPKTCDTAAEDACKVASHLSIDRTHDKRGIRRQARYIQAVLKQTSRELLESFSHPSFAPFGLSPCLTHGPDLTRHIHSSLDQALLWGNQWNKSKLCSEQRQIRSLHAFSRP